MTRRAPASTPPANPRWGEDWPSVRAEWSLDPSITHLNHGAFGACPHPVLDEQAAWRAEMERRPVEFLDRRVRALLDAARTEVAARIGADAEGFVFVHNATTAVATVLGSLRLAPGDRVVVTDHAYPAVRVAVASACRASGARESVVTIPLPLPRSEEIVEAVAREAAGARLVIVDHIASQTAAMFPVHEIVAACRKLGTPVLVDAAHAPAMLDVAVDSIGADFWTGNFHKWACAPKGAAALVLAPDWRDRVRPLVASHGFEGGLHQAFDWTGTADPSAWLSVPAAFDFLASLGWDRLREHNQGLLAEGVRSIAQAIGARPIDPAPGAWMGVVEVPHERAATQEEASDLRRRLFDDDRIEVPVTMWRGRALLRVSAHAHNRPADFERLAGALPRRLAKARRTP